MLPAAQGNSRVFRQEDSDSALLDSKVHPGHRLHCSVMAAAKVDACFLVEPLQDRRHMLVATISCLQHEELCVLSLLRTVARVEWFVTSKAGQCAPSSTHSEKHRQGSAVVA